MGIAKAHDQLVGRTLGDFVLRERIGEGGFGAVYRANQPALDREAVIKVLRPELHASAAATERFLREAKLASKLDHPYAAHIYAFGAEADGELWIAMELVRGTPLDQVLKIQGPLPLERFVPLLERICEVVQTAHDEGIVHRDLKPANVMVLARAGRLLPKLLDFGIAKGLVASPAARPSEADIGRDSTVRIVGELDLGTGATLGGGVATSDTMATGERAPESTTGRFDLTQQGAIMGSPPYMAPEQWIDASSADARADLYALAVLAYEALVGKPPFTGVTVQQIAFAHARAAVPALPSKFPAALDKVFAKALAKKAAERYPDALAFATAFRQASGIADEPVGLPALDPKIRDAATAGAPQPIAEAIAALEAARNAHQARDAVMQLARTIVRYLGLVALSCRSRVTSGDESSALGDAMRVLGRRALTDREWLELARLLTAAWLERRDAYPMPELVEACHERGVLDELDALLALRDRETASSESLVATLQRAIAGVAKVLDALGFLADYALVVTLQTGVAERWMGVRRTQRTTVPVRGKGLATGVAALLDSDGVPVLSLAPLIQVAAPSPGAPPELFLFEGRDARGAKLVALPTGFERHDEELWPWLRGQLSGALDEDTETINDERPPYRGLSAFSAEDSASFFGREKLVDAFVNRLKVQPLLAVVGRSGAGKSSFVHAGVVPALGWRALTIRPGASPLGSLVARLEHEGFDAAHASTPNLRAQSGQPIGDLREAIAHDRATLGALLRGDAALHGPIVLVIDQLEELFTLCQDADERRIFAEAVSTAARAAEDPVRVIFTLRDDFLVRTEQQPALRNRIAHGLQLVTVPAADDLLRILVEPARRAGYEFDDPALPDEMVKAVADQPGALALISFTAAKLWELRDRHFKQLTRAAYKTLGGVGGALARHADVTLDEMTPEERALVREAFRHLVTTQNTRAVLSRDELRQLLGGKAAADRVIEKLVAARLLVASENDEGIETIEIIHEALLSTWPRLLEWRRDDAEGARFREQLRAAAAQWHERGRAKGLLWRGDALADLQRWRARHPGPLTEIEAAFVGASQSDAARGRRNLRVLVASAFAALVAVVIVLVGQNARVAGQRARAEESAAELHDNLENQYEDQGRRLVLDNDPLLALAYLAKAAELGASGRAHDFLVAEAVRATDGERFAVHHDGGVKVARFSHDGRRLVTAGKDLAARIWNADDGKPIATTALEANGIAVYFLPDDRTFLAGAENGEILLADAATGARVAHMTHPGTLACLVMSPDGTRAVSAGHGDAAVVWQLPAATEIRRFGSSDTRSCAISQDGALIAAADGKGVTRIWKIATGELRGELHGHTEPVFRMAFSPDATRLVTTSYDSTAIIWDVATARSLHVLHHEDQAGPVVWSSDGKMLFTGSDDRTVAVWDAATGARKLTLAGHDSEVNALALSPDDSLLVSVSEDTNTDLWDTHSGRLLAKWRGSRGALEDVAFDPNGSRVVAASLDGSAIVFAASSQDSRTTLPSHVGGVWGLEFSPDGRRLVSAGSDGLAIVSDTASGKPVFKLAGHDGVVTKARFSPDGRWIATGGRDGKVLLWDAATGAAVRTLAHETDIVREIAWSPDGRTLVAAGQDGSLLGWEVQTGALTIDRHGPQLRWVAYDPTGRTIATVLESGSAVTFRDASGAVVRTIPTVDNNLKEVEFDRSGRHVLVLTQRSVRILDVVTGQDTAELLGHAGLVESAVWSPDGELIATSSEDGTTQISAPDGRELAMWRTRIQVWSVAFSPDSHRIALGYGDGAVEILDIPTDHGPADLARVLACRVPFRVEGDRVTRVALDPHRCAAP